MTAATTQHVYVPGLGGWCLCCGSRSSDPRHVPARSAAANEPDYGTIDVPATPTTDEEIAKLPVFDLDTHTASAAKPLDLDWTWCIGIIAFTWMEQPLRFWTPTWEPSRV